MAVSIVTYTGDGSTTQYVITFEYISRDDVVVTIDDVAATFTFVNDTTVEFSSAPAADAKIVIKRGTPSAPLVDFADGSTLFEADLDLAHQQSRYLAEEARDIAEDAKSTVDANIDDVLNVSSISTDVTTVAGQISPTNNISTLGGIASDITTAAGISTAISNVSSISSAVSTVSSDSADVQNLASISADLQTLADLEDGTTATNALSDLAAISSQISSVAADQADIGVVSSNIASVSTVATNINHVIDVANDLNEAVSEIETVANDLNEATSEIEIVSNNIADVQTVGTNISSVSTLAGLNTEITNLNSISAAITGVNAVSSGVVSLNAISGEIQSLDNISTDISSVSSISSDVSTVANNLSEITNFASIYRTGTSEPSTSLDTGDLFYNTSTGTLKIYNGTGWEAGVTAGSGFLPTTGGGLTGDLTFGDNVKATFGAGSDLQIYHDGSNSIIKDSGAGDLRIMGSDDVRIVDAVNEDNMARFNKDGAVTLYYDNAAKFATTSTGINVTGTVTADGLTVEGQLPTITLTDFDTSGSRVIALNNANDIGSEIKSTGNANSKLIFTTHDGTSNIDRVRIESDGDISFYEATGTTAKFFWDAAAESLGIGTTSPSVSLDINSTDAVQMPAGTDAQRPSSPANGMIRYSTTSGSFEGYQAGAWAAICGAGDVGAPTLSGSSSANEFSDTTVTITDYDASLIYRVSVTGGSYTRSGGTITWTLPSVTTDTIHYITVNAIDNGVTSPDAEWDIDVLNVAFTGDTGIQITNFASNTSNTGWAV